MQREIVRTIIDHYFAENSSTISIGDLLYELGTQENNIRYDLVDLQRYGNIVAEDDEISLDGKAANLIKLAESIVDEMIKADEYDGNEDQAKQIFYNLVDEF